MGLYAHFEPMLQEEITAGDVGYPEMEDAADPIPIDYSGAFGHMVATFMEVATDLVPVDTGYLQSTIHATTSGGSADFFADAEYAQYVEYGTSKMGAQPYFEPALDEALDVFITEAMQAMTRAQQEMEQLLQNIMAAAMEAVANMMGSPFGGMSPMGLGQMTTGAYMGGLALGAGLMLLAFPLLVNLYGIMDTIMSPFDPVANAIDDLKTEGIDVIIT